MREKQQEPRVVAFHRIFCCRKLPSFFWPSLVEVRIGDWITLFRILEWLRVQNDVELAFVVANLP